MKSLELAKNRAVSFQALYDHSLHQINVNFMRLNTMMPSCTKPPRRAYDDDENLDPSLSDDVAHDCDVDVPARLHLQGHLHLVDYRTGDRENDYDLYPLFGFPGQ